MLLYKVWYFFYFGGMVCIWPYINILYRSNGLNDAQIGILAAVKPWTSAPASFLWAGLADRFLAHKVIMISTFVLSTLTRTSVSACHTFAAFLVLSLLGEFLAAPVGVMADAAVVAACKRDTDYGKSRLWGAVAWGSFSAVSGTMVAHFGTWSGFLAYMVLSVPCVVCAWKMDFRLGTQHKQQAQRVAEQQQQQQRSKTAELQSAGGRSITPAQGRTCEAATDVHHHSSPKHQHQGSGLELPVVHSKQQGDQDNCALDSIADADADACALLMDHSIAADYSSRQQQHLQLVFKSVKQQQHGCSNAAQTVDDSRAQQDQAWARWQQRQQQCGQDFWQGLHQLLTTPAVLIFMWQATVMGFGIGAIGEFLFLFLQDLGGSETLMGLTLTVTCIAEVPMFHFQPQILKIVSVHSMLHLVMWTYTLRMGLYAMLPYMRSAWAVLPIELLHGITFGCGWSAGTITSKRVAPPGLEATMQGIFQGLYFGVGQGLGALVGGQLKQRHGGQAMFAMCACMVLAGWVTCVVAEQLTACAASSRSEAAAQPSCCSSGSKALGQALQQKVFTSRLQQLWENVIAVEGSRTNSDDDGVFLSDASRQWKYKYAGLASKDSGPDLWHQAPGAEQLESGACSEPGRPAEQIL